MRQSVKEPVDSHKAMYKYDIFTTTVNPALEVILLEL